MLLSLRKPRIFARILSCVRYVVRLLFGVTIVIQWRLFTRYDGNAQTTFFRTEINRSMRHAQTANDTEDMEVTSFQDRIAIVVLSDRWPNSTGGPLHGLVRSLLAHTTSPIAFHYISNHPYSWLEETLHQPPWFLVKRHEVSTLSVKVDALTNRTGFRSKHYSARFCLRKLYIPSLDFSIGNEKPPSSVL